MIWREYVVPRLTDYSLRGTEVHGLRERTCRGLQGRVLEVGFGSGLNIDSYPPTVAAVTAIEPSDVAWRLSERRRGLGGIPIERAGPDGQSLPSPAASHDAALVTFSLCTIPDPLRALQEVRRVLRADGRLHLLEHGIAPDAPIRRWQRRLEPIQRRVAGGCHLTRDVPALVTAAGFGILEQRDEYLPGPRASHPWTYLYRLVAAA